MKTKLVVLEVPETCEHCCEDCPLSDGEIDRCDGPVIKGNVLTITKYLRTHPMKPYHVQEMFVMDAPRPTEQGKERK